MIPHEVIKANNKLIAEFMGMTIKAGQWHESFVGWYNTNGFLEQEYIYPENLLFHTWDWLMPVIVKIKRMQHDSREMFMGTTLERFTEFRQVTELPICTPIETVWNHVVNFINWYNKQKKIIS